PGTRIPGPYQVQVNATLHDSLRLDPATLLLGVVLNQTTRWDPLSLEGGDCAGACRDGSLAVLATGSAHPLAARLVDQGGVPVAGRGATVAVATVEGVPVVPAQRVTTGADGWARLGLDLGGAPPSRLLLTLRQDTATAQDAAKPLVLTLEPRE